jgi:3-oxochol-4-en-24-oyl-CoA dehydrogenase
VLPTLIVHGTPQQQERFIGPTLAGEILWCQMFSEPGAGSDLASLTTRADKIDGGWAITGQKVWTTMAHIADWGICLARTNPTAPKHLGISCFLVDLKTPGIDVRPLRELTGAEMFNEVFFDEVFVPDDLVVGEVDDGWEAARTTLANERVSMGSGGSFGPGVEGLLAHAGEGASAVVVDRVGRLLAESHAIAALGWRSTLRALTGADPGPEASVRKLLGVEHEQRIQELGLGLLGPAGAVDEGDGAAWIGGYLGNRCLSIAGGTSEIQRNVIAERLLGLPKDP